MARGTMGAERSKLVKRACGHENEKEKKYVVKAKPVNTTDAKLKWKRKKYVVKAKPVNTTSGAGCSGF